jgi:hypothetical protein
MMLLEKSPRFSSGVGTERIFNSLDEYLSPSQAKKKNVLSFPWITFGMVSGPPTASP